MRAALPDVQIHIRDMVVEGERVAVRVVLEGTHAGDGLGTKATNRRVQVAGIVIVRIVDGRIVEGWNSWDQLGLLQQLGGLPSPETDRFLAR
jgi:predicted ester cyclase